MTLMSRTTNSLSSVIEQNAFSRSSSFLTSLTRTSVISMSLASPKLLPSVVPHDNASAACLSRHDISHSFKAFRISLIEDEEHGGTAAAQADGPHAERFDGFLQFAKFLVKLKTASLEHICAHSGHEINPVFVQKGGYGRMQLPVESRIVTVVGVNLFGGGVYVGQDQQGREREIAGQSR